MDKKNWFSKTETDERTGKKVHVVRDKETRKILFSLTEKDNQWNKRVLRERQLASY